MLKVLEHGIPSEKISLALMFSGEELGVTTDLSQDDVLTLTDATKLSSYLKALHRIFIGQKQKEQNELETEKVDELVAQAKKLKEVKAFDALHDGGLNEMNSSEKLSTSKQAKRKGDKANGVAISPRNLSLNSNPSKKDAKASHEKASATEKRARNKTSDLSSSDHLNSFGKLSLFDFVFNYV